MMEYHVNGWKNGTVRRNGLAQAHEQAVALREAANTLETLTDALSRRARVEISVSAGGYAIEQIGAAETALQGLIDELAPPVSTACLEEMARADVVELERAPADEAS
jgi:hypothetical protein